MLELSSLSRLWTLFDMKDAVWNAHSFELSDPYIIGDKRANTLRACNLLWHIMVYNVNAQVYDNT